MAKKDFLVIGLGQFGMSVAKTLARQGYGVIAIDKNKEHVQEIAEDVEYAVVGDGTDPQLLSTLGLERLDAAVIAVTNDMEASIMATITVKEMGVRKVVVKAISDMHEKIVLKLGADSVVFPERFMGERTAKNLTAGSFVDLVELSPEITIAELAVKKEWIGKSLIDLSFRKEYQINVVAVKEDDRINVSPEPDKPLSEGQILVVIGSYKSLGRLNIK